MNKKIALVTGASQGVGRTIAIHLAKKNYFIVLLARNQDKLKTVHETILQQGGSCTYYSADVADAEQVKSCVRNIIETHGKIDLLFNNAGILKHGTSTLADSEIDELLKINLNGAIYVAKYVAEQMKAQKNGYIINLSSLGGKVAASFAGIYAASKFGLTGFSEALAKEMSLYHVKVTNICPHVITTEMTAGRTFKPEDMIEQADIEKTIDYLLSLSKNAIPLELVIHCMPFIEKMVHSTYQVYGLKKDG